MMRHMPRRNTCGRAGKMIQLPTVTSTSLARAVTPHAHTMRQGSLRQPYTASLTTEQTYAARGVFEEFQAVSGVFTTRSGLFLACSAFGCAPLNMPRSALT
eukprot:2004644-Alexandrium_andersonii.AAC.1